MERVTADDVRNVLAAFFTGDPPAEEIRELVTMIVRMSDGFINVLGVPTGTSSTAPPERTEATTEFRTAEVAAGTEDAEAK